MSKKPYNTTDLDPETTFKRHVFHRDQFAHYLRWSHVLKEARIGESVVDFGCGKGELLEVLYRNRFKPSRYVGFDIREKTIEKNKEKFKNLKFPAYFHAVDLIDPGDEWLTQMKAIEADKVVSFEVAEHVGKQNIKIFLKNFKLCGYKGSTYYLSTPNYDPDVGAAGNHTYDSGDGRGVAEQEFTHRELKVAILEAGFKIVSEFGTFASQKDYVKKLSHDWQREAFDALNKYYDSNLVSNLMAPIIPAYQSRNILWVLK